MEHGTPLERFYAKVNLPADDGCWVWTGGRKKAGYGQFFVDGHKVIAHRWAYAHFVGPIPADHEVDHRCTNPPCVNPAHLEAVTLQENRRRRVERKTHCIKGHEYTPENSYYYVDDQGYTCRHCRACGRETALRRFRAKRDQASTASDA
jgi:hypothetical protein